MWVFFVVGNLFGYAQKCFWWKNSKPFFFPNFFPQKYFVFFFFNFFSQNPIFHYLKFFKKISSFFFVFFFEFFSRVKIKIKKIRKKKNEKKKHKKRNPKIYLRGGNKVEKNTRQNIFAEKHLKKKTVTRELVTPNFQIIFLFIFL